MNDLLTEEGHRAQREQAKSLGMSLMGRLQLAQTELESVVSIVGSAQVSLERLNSHMFRRLGFTDGESMDKALPPLGKAQRSHLGSGKTLASIVPLPDAPASVFLVRAGELQGTPGYFFGEINPDSLWGDERDRPESFCVLDGNDSPLLCSGLPRAALQQLGGRKTSSGDFVWGNEGSGNFASFWEVLLEPQFLTRKWTVVISEPEAQALEPMSEFRRMFVPVIVAALIIVMLLSVTQIRRSLVPLEKLIDGTRRVAANDFKAQVTVSSNDEFADLANSFNSMTVRLGRQFNALAAMSEIDRHILAALDVEHVVNVVLSRTYDVTPCDFICLLRFENGVKRTGFFYLSAAHSRMTAMRYELTLPEDEAQALVKHPRAEIWKTGPTVPSYLEPLAKQGATSSLVLPILLKEGLSAVMCLGYLEDFVPGDEQIAQARDFADRIAVALSNAAWEEKLYHRAHYDALTGLPNRLLLRDRLQHALSRAGRNGSQVAIMFIDMDRFKSLNDSLGHPAGDKYLIEIARGLSAAVRAEDTVARLGGDEFVVVAADLPGKEDPVTVTTSLADKILAAVSKSLDLDGREISLSASIGISLFPRDGESVDDLLKNADSAMYHAKESGKNTYRFYSRRLTLEALERLELENDLRRAIERREFEVYYQPRIDRLRQKIVAAEALIRWNHPRQGLLPPVKFIKVAEETGLFIPIGEWVLRTACSQLKAWQKQGLPELRMAVNISALQVRSPILIERILQTLSETGLEPGYLELELTESIMMEDVRRTTGFIGDLSNHGIKLAVDDFGTGYSSLTYLKTFLIHILKIDQSFVRNIATSKQDQAIVKAVITLARSLNIATVAEGVETREQLQILAELGCDELQGYLYSKPVPALEFAKMLSGRIPQLAPALV